MNIQSVSLAQSNFTSNNSRRTNTDRVATLQDLYEMEDRITANQEKLIKNQNEMLGKTLQSMSQLIYHDYDEYFDQAMDDAAMLKLNVNA
jgi:hypothetical protein